MKNHQPRFNGRIFAALILLAAVAIGNTPMVLCSQTAVTPQQLYHHAWQTTAQCIFDTKALANWQAWEHKFDGTIKTDDEAVADINQALDSLDDQYTVMLTRQERIAEKAEEDGTFSGVGIVYAFKEAGGRVVFNNNGKPAPATDKDGHPIIARVIAGSPAEKAGMQAGDIIVAVNGQDPDATSFDALIKQVHGKPGTAVTFSIDRNGLSLTISVVRATIAVADVTYRMLPGNIGYIRLDDFDRNDATEETKDALKALKGARAIILDLRSNPGGFVFNAIGISSLFIEQGTIVTERDRIAGDPANPQYASVTESLTNNQLLETTRRTDRNDVAVEASARQPYMLAQRPLVILVNGETASAAEMTTAALHDNHVAVVVGTNTFGKGIGQTMVQMDNGTELHVTSLRYYTPSGAWLGDGGNTVSYGIQPDYVVRPRLAVFTYGSTNDNQLASAIAYLNQPAFQKAGTGQPAPAR
jgi:carboxyl-terminal processing protease